MSTTTGYVLGVGAVRAAVRAAPSLLVLAILTVPLAGCLAPASQQGEGVVVTGQPILDAFQRMGETDALAGIPSWAATDAPLEAERVGRPFTIDPEAVIRLDPTLVLDQPHPLVSGPSREALASGVQPAGIEYRELPTEPRFSTIHATLEAVEETTGTPARPVWQAIRARLDALNETLTGLDRPRAMMLFPAGLTAGNGTDADVILELAGLENAAAKAGLTGYRQITDEAIQRVGVDYVLATSTMRDPAAEIAAMPMFEGTPVEGNASRVLVVDPSRSARLGPYVAHAAERIAAFTHPSLPGPHVDVTTEPMEVPACGTIEVATDAPNATVTWLGQTHTPGQVPVPDVPDGHYILTVAASDATGVASVTQLVSVEGSNCA